MSQIAVLLFLLFTIITIIMFAVVIATVIIIIVVIVNNNACNICTAQCWCRSCPAISCFAADWAEKHTAVHEQHKDQSQLDT